MRIRLFILLFSLSLPFIGYSQQSTTNCAKYVFLFIGDGMGIQQVNTAKVYADSVLKTSENLGFTKFPVTSFATTYAGTRYITCSAAAGTALSTGSKTSPSTLGLNATHTDTLFSIAKTFKDMGRKVAILTSVSIDHATPAAFYAHVPKRNEYYRIGTQLITSNFDFFASGGFLDPYGDKGGKGSPSLYSLGAKQGVGFTSTLTGVDSLKLAGAHSIVYSAPNPASSSTLQYDIDRSEQDITLAQITAKAIDVVDNPDGFFMMVEGGKIDWACHDNDAATTIHEVIAFSDAVDVAIRFYNQHPHETLIVITADHETGGMALGNSYNGYNNNLSLLQGQKVSQEKLHNQIADMKKSSPNASFDQVLAFVLQQTGLPLSGKFALTEDDLNRLRSAYTDFFCVKSESSDRNMYSSTDKIAATALSILNRNAGIGWTSSTHTGCPVPVFALGAGQQDFTRHLDNTDIPKYILKAAGY